MKMLKQSKLHFYSFAGIMLALAFLFGMVTDQGDDYNYGQEYIPAPGAIYLIHVEGLVDNGLHKYIQRGLSQATANEASGVILHINTFGGLVDAADKIRNNLLDSDLTIVSFIDKNAASAGALIAIATDSIFMAPGSSIGAATVVDGAGSYASEKMQSYMRGIMRATAEATGRDPRLAEAMVDERIVIEGVVEEGQLLTLSTTEAVRLGLANGSFRNIDQVMEHMGWEEKELFDFQEFWAESVLRFLSNPVITSLLMLMMLGGLWFELQSPGIGFPGTIAGIGALLFFAPLSIMGLAQSWEILLFIIGVGLILVEVFVLPGFGISGILGITLVIFSMGISLIGNVGLSFPEMHQITQAIWTMAITLILGVAMISSMIRYLPDNKMFNKLVLVDQTDRNHGYTSSDSKDDLLGLEGVAITSLRPSGTILIQDRRIDVVSVGDFIEKGAQVRVVDTSGSRVMVTRMG